MRSRHGVSRVERRPPSDDRRSASQPNNAGRDKAPHAEVTTSSRVDFVPAEVKAYRRLELQTRLERIKKIDECIHLSLSHGQESILVAALEDCEAQVRASAAETLGRMGAMASPHAKRVALLLRDEDAFCRFSAVEALGNIGSAARAFAGVLAERLDDDKVRVREAAAWALQEVGSDLVGTSAGEVEAPSSAGAGRSKAAESAYEVELDESE